MAITAHVFPYGSTSALEKLMNFGTTPDSIGCLLIASGTFAWNATAEGLQYVSTFLASGSGSGALTEVSTTGTGYSRFVSSAPTLTTSGLVTTLSMPNPTWSSATFSAVYACFYDATPAADSSRPLLCYWDLGGAQSVTSSTFTLQINASGLVTWTAS